MFSGKLYISKAYFRNKTVIDTACKWYEKQNFSCVTVLLNVE